MATLEACICSFLAFSSLLSSASQAATLNPKYKAFRFDTGGLRREKFPKGFVFGSATSAYQVEGAVGPKYGRGSSIWDDFVMIPGNIKGGATGHIAVDQYHRYKEDIDLMHELNFDAYRFSIAWPRIFPNGTGEVNWQGVAYYHRLIDYLLEKGITPYACLYHYDLPQALQDRYLGMLGEQFVTDFADYAEFCFKQFGDKVKYWFSFNEPRVVAALGFDNGLNPPCRCSKAFGNCTAGDSATEPYIAAHHMILAHSEAHRRYREKYCATQKGKFGILLDFVWYEPLTRGLQDEYAAQRARDFHIGWFLHPLVYGEYPRTMQEIVGDRLPKFTKSQVKVVKGAFDVIGINQYTSYYMSNVNMKYFSNVTGYQQDWHVQFNFEKKGKLIGPMAHSSWLYQVPYGMYKAVMYVKEHYKNPLMFLSENGMDQPGNLSLSQGIKDYGRIWYYKNYLLNLKKAIDDGANMYGYFAWSLIDNFEWLLGYTSRFGIVYVDRAHKLTRYPKLSAYWFRQLIAHTNSSSLRY